MKTNHPIAHNPIMRAVLLRNGTLVPDGRYPGKNVPIPTPRSEKERRKWNKTIRLARKRLARDPVAALDAHMKRVRAEAAKRRPW